MALIERSDYTGEETHSTFTKDKFLLFFYLKDIKESRFSLGENVENFPFNESRCRLLSKINTVSNKTTGILYWMIRECRVQDNWSMIFAQRLALKNKVPLYVCFTIFEAHYLYPTRRHQQFLIDGLQCVEKECQELNIPFYLLNNSPEELSDIILKYNIGGVVCDFNPLKKPKEWVESLLKTVPEHVPVVQVDAHNIVPTWVTSEKQEHMARTIRPKIYNKLSEYLTDFPGVTRHPYMGKLDIETCAFDKAIALMNTTWDLDGIPSIKAGPEAGLEMLYTFITKRLMYFGISSNDPSKIHTSNLSFWLNFGHISAQRVALEVNDVKSLYEEQVEKYFESLIIAKELAENYCYYNDNYDNFNGAPEWAQSTLLQHKSDQRPYLYTKEQFAVAATHDECWNAAQLQLLREGTIHRYLRMYWCKKILEWTRSPEEAVEVALWLNNTFALDGNVPNSFVGVMWAICAVHDLWYPERKIFGRIRFMVDYSLKRKYDMKSFCARYGIEISPEKSTSMKNGKKGVKRKALYL